MTVDLGHEKILDTWFFCVTNVKKVIRMVVYV